MSKLHAVAEDRKFNKQQEPKAQEKQPQIDKLMAFQWVHKKLENLFEITDKKAKKEYEQQIFKKLKTKFGV